MGARLLGEADLPLVLDLVGADPVLNVYIASRVDAGVLSPSSPGQLWGYPAPAPRSLLHVGTNLVPLATDAEARRAFVELLGPYRPFVAIVGLTAEVRELAALLAARWGGSFARPRAVRERQPVLAATSRCPIAPDPRVQRIGRTHLDAYFAASVAMYREELEEDPLATNAAGYRNYIAGLVESGRAYGVLSGDRVVFKADIGAVGGSVAQVQGVWIDPELRGRGLAAPAMAAVTAAILDSGRTASLYVNDFNTAAIATYRRCGYVEYGVFTTVLF